MGGIEKNWLEKLTALHAPLKIFPTKEYYSSYYYQIDKLSVLSSYKEKTIQEKLEAVKTDPYDPLQDWELSPWFPQKELTEEGKERDLVKDLCKELTLLERDLSFQNYEMSGALMRLCFLEDKSQKISFLSQMNYLMSFCGKNPHLPFLFVPLSVPDLNHLFKQIHLDPFALNREVPQKISTKKEQGLFQEYLFFKHLLLKKVKTPNNWQIKGSFLPQKRVFSVYLDPFTHRLFLDPPLEKESFMETLSFFKEENGFFCKEKNRYYPLETSFFFANPQIFSAEIIEETLYPETEEIVFLLYSDFQGIPLRGTSSFSQLQIEEASAKTHFSSIPENPPLWVYQVGSEYFLPEREGAKGIVIPKNYQENGSKVGDFGHLSFFSKAATSQQEMRFPFYVAGFYDPGVIPIGNRFLLVPPEMTQTINASSFTPSSEEAFNGFFIWTKGEEKVEVVQKKLTQRLEEKGLLPYWNVLCYKEYPFSRSLLQQFQSDKTLFILIALLIILVACSNIVSLLILLVKDKKREIAIIKALGAPPQSILFIFGFSGAIMGLLSCLLGTLAAIGTLHHLDLLVAILSKIQGHSAFQTAFFGEKLPNTLSLSSLKLIWIVTPVLSSLAGCIPAIQAFRVNPSQTLRSS